MNLVLIILCGIAVLALCVFVARRHTDGGGYRRRFENRYRRDATSDAAAPMIWVPTLGSGGETGEHHHAPGADAHCGAGSDGGAPGCGDGGTT
jgi:hypothetical protein